MGGAQIAYCRLMTTRVTPSEGGAKDTRPACTATEDFPGGSVLRFPDDRFQVLVWREWV